MKRFATGLFFGAWLSSGAAFAIGYTLSRGRNVSTAQIDAFFQIAVDRGAWPGTAATIDQLCGERTATGGRVTVHGSRSGTDTQMAGDQATAGDSISVP